MAPFQCGQRPGGAQQHQVGPHAIDAGGHGTFCSVVQHGVGPVQLRQGSAGRHQGMAQRLLGRFVLRGHSGRVGIKTQARAQDGAALRGAVGVGQQHRQAKAVQQLRAQFAFFRVHGADQHKTRRMLLRNAIALDRVNTAGGGVQQRVNQRVRQQVHFVHIQNALVRPCQQARLQAHAAIAQHVFNVQTANQLLETGRQRQGDKGRARQQRGQGARGGRFGGAARPADQHAANAGVDGGQLQSALQHRLADQRGQRKLRAGGGMQGRFRVVQQAHTKGPSPCASSRCSSASRCCSMRPRWSPGASHMPRCMASSRRWPMLRSASGLCCSKNARLVSSCR